MFSKLCRGVAFSYFHDKIGPMIMNNTLDIPMDNYLNDKILSGFDTGVENGYMILCLTDYNIKIYNFYFELVVYGARGDREMFLVSIIMNNEHISIEDEEKIVKTARKIIDKFEDNNYTEHKFFKKPERNKS